MFGFVLKPLGPGERRSAPHRDRSCQPVCSRMTGADVPSWSVLQRTVSDGLVDPIGRAGDHFVFRSSLTGPIESRERRR
jgi:hypothetical protein